MLGIDSTTGHIQVARNACIWEPGEACSRLERWLQHLFGCVDYRQPCPSLKNLEALNWVKGKRKSSQKAQDTRHNRTNEPWRAGCEQPITACGVPTSTSHAEKVSLC